MRPMVYRQNEDLSNKNNIAALNSYKIIYPIGYPRVHKIEEWGLKSNTGITHNIFFVLDEY